MGTRLLPPPREWMPSNTETQKENKERIGKIPTNTLYDVVDTDTELYRHWLVDSHTSKTIAREFGMPDIITPRCALPPLVKPYPPSSASSWEILNGSILT